jgi:hypothetical protein
VSYESKINSLLEVVIAMETNGKTKQNEKKHVANQEIEEKYTLQIKKITKHIVQRICCREDVITKHPIQILS